MAKNQSSIGWKANFEALRYVPRFFQLIWETDRLLFATNVLVRLVQSLVPVFMLWLGKLIIDEVVLQMNVEVKTWSYLWTLIAFELGLAILSDLLSRATSLTDGLMGDLYSNRSSVLLIQKAANLQLSQFEDPEFYDKLERARRQTNNRVSLMTTILSQAQDLITVISLIAGLIVFQPVLIVLLIIAIVPSFMSEIRFSRSSYSLVRSWTPERRELDYLRYIGASDVTAKEVKLFDLSAFLSNRFNILAQKYYLANRLLAIKRALWGSVFHVVGDLSYYGAYVVIILRTVNNVISLGDLTFLAGSFRRLRNQLQTIFSRLTRITESALYLKDYFDFMDLKDSTADSNGYHQTPSRIAKGIRFDGVSFSYPGSDQLVLDQISFELRPNEKIALVGENGAGKTTLIKLLMRMYKPTSGKIYLDDIDIWSYGEKEYRRLFGVIFQDFVKYYFTAGENIAVGKIDELANHSKIEYAAEKSLANQVVEGLPAQYAQPLGKRFHNGIELSGGQWQKIALARAYMKDAKMIVLDEPTAALDARAEYEAFQRFTELSVGKMAVLISHRFSTVRMADRILVLKDGRIVENGSHDHLIEKNGLYAELFHFQAEGYK